MERLIPGLPNPQEDIERMIQEKSQLRARPVNLAATKALLIQQRDGANTEEEAAAVTAELERINELDRRESQKKQEKRLNISNINKRNKAPLLLHVGSLACMPLIPRWMWLHRLGSKHGDVTCGKPSFNSI